MVVIVEIDIEKAVKEFEGDIPNKWIRAFVKWLKQPISSHEANISLGTKVERINKFIRVIYNG